jgi:hypothetical protein
MCFHDHHSHKFRVDLRLYATLRRVSAVLEKIDSRNRVKINDGYGKLTTVWMAEREGGKQNWGIVFYAYPSTGD